VAGAGATRGGAGGLGLGGAAGLGAASGVAPADAGGLGGSVDSPVRRE